MAIGRPYSASSERMVSTRSRMPSWLAWLMLMRKTSAPASKRRARTARSWEAGPSVATILQRRRRLMGASGIGACGARFGQLDRPVLRILAGVDFEEARPVEAAHETFVAAGDLEL